MNNFLIFKNNLYKSSFNNIEIIDLLKKESFIIETGHFKEIESIYISESKNLLITGSRDYTAKLIDLTTNLVLKTFSGHRAPVYNVFICSNSNFAFTFADGIKKWNIKTGECLNSFNMMYSKNFIFDEKNNQIFYYSFGINPATINSWKIGEVESKIVLKKHVGLYFIDIIDLNINTFASIFYEYYNKKSISICYSEWDKLSLKCIKTNKISSEKKIKCFAVAPDQIHIIFGGYDIIIWNKLNNEIVYTYTPTLLHGISGIKQVLYSNSKIYFELDMRYYHHELDKLDKIRFVNYYFPILIYHQDNFFLLSDGQVYFSKKQNNDNKSLIGNIIKDYEFKNTFLANKSIEWKEYVIITELYKIYHDVFVDNLSAGNVIYNYRFDILQLINAFSFLPKKLILNYLLF